MNEQFPPAEIKDTIETLVLPAHETDLEMEPRYHVPGELRSVTTTLIEPMTPMEYIGSTETEPDEQEIKTVTQQLVFGAPKAWGCYERGLILHWKVTEEVLEQLDDHQQFLADIMPPPSVPPAVSDLQYKERNKVLLEQLALGELIL